MKRVPNRRYTKTAKANSVPLTDETGVLDSSFTGATGSLGYSLNVVCITSFTPVSGETRYLGSFIRTPSLTAAEDKVYIPIGGTLEIAQIEVFCSSAPSTEAWSFYLRLNDTTDYLIATVSDASQNKSFVNLAMALSVVAGDYFQIKVVNPTWVSTPGTVQVSGHVYISEAA